MPIRSKNLESKNIAEALKLLNEAAAEEATEIHDLIKKNYPELKENLFGKKERLKKKSYDTIKSKVSEKFVNARRVSEKPIKEMGTKVNDHVHGNPWPFIGTIALLSFILGLIAGRDD